ncbi:MAG: holo-[acyl-carrier-protein] synthase [Actinobacteria bacterium]|nr:holo-[acyl-carrier-protein] synthase [Actinomycetota bacterium]
MALRRCPYRWCVHIVGLGTDLVEVARFRLAMERRGERLNERLFSDEERAYAAKQKDPAKSLAARFGAKEAVMKAMGVGLWKFKLRDVEVAKAKSGAPSVKLHGRAAEMAAERGIVAWQLSLTHTETTALAVAIAIGRNLPDET